MGLKLTANTLTEQHAVLNTPCTAYKDDLDYDKRIYEFLEYKEQEDIHRINEACDNYKFLMLCSLNEIDQNAIKEQLRKVGSTIFDLISRAYAYLLSKYKTNVQLSSLEQDLARIDSVDSFTIKSAQIVIDKPSGAVQEAFKDILGKFSNITDMLSTFAESDVPSNIDKLEEKINSKEANQNANRSFAYKVYDIIGVHFVQNDNGQKAFERKTYIFDKGFTKDFVKSRIKCMKAINEQFQKALALATIHKKKAKRLMDRIDQKGAPTPEMIRYMNLLKRDIAYTYGVLTRTGAALSTFCDMNVRNIKLLLDQIFNYRPRGEATIHGEDFNSDTLFDTLTDEDFNRTEWMDIALAEADFEFGKICREAYREAYLQECLMYLEEFGPSIEKLKFINEAMDQKTKGAAFEAIYKAMQDLIEKWRVNIINYTNTDKPYLTKYKATITGDTREIPILDGSKTGGYIFSGLKAINSFEYPKFDYNGTNADKFKDKETYLKWVINTSGSFSAHKNIDRTIAENSPINYIKAYFGYKYLKNNQPVDISLSQKNDIIANMDTIYNTLIDPGNVVNKIKGNFERIKREANSKDNSIPNSQPVQAPTQNSTGGNKTEENNKPETKQEGAYSLIYDKYILEFETNSAATVTNAQTAQTQNSNTTNPDSQKGSAIGDYEKCKKVYIQSMHDIMKAQMTAFEYIRNEYRQIVRAKVNYYHPDSKNDQAEPKQGNA